MPSRHFVQPAILFSVIIASCSLTSSAEPWQPIRLQSYPQKLRAFYKLDDPKAPPSLFTNAQPLPAGSVTATAKSSDGAIWLGTTQGLVRLDLTAPVRDQRQYLAGMR